MQVFNRSAAANFFPFQMYLNSTIYLKTQYNKEPSYQRNDAWHLEKGFEQTK